MTYRPHPNNNTRPPADAAEQEAADHAQAFVHELRLLFDAHGVEMRSLVAVVPSGMILTLGEATTACEEAGVEAINAWDASRDDDPKGRKN